MEIKNVPITPDTIVERGGEVKPMGPVALNLPEGLAHGHDAAGLTMITAQHPDGEVVIALVTSGYFYGHLVALLAQLNPMEARAFGASLIRAADAIDGGGVPL